MEQPTHPLRAYRKLHGIALGDLASRLGIHKSVLSRLERYGHNASADLLRRIADVTGGEVTPNDVLGVNQSEAA
jgi:transcriptional regulator with XRE-family HTH domain